jgi:hypothetical protein
MKRDPRQSLCSIELPMEYRLLKPNGLYGEGRTLAMCSRLVRFSCDADLPPGQMVTLVVAWPAELADGTKLSLWFSGKIVLSVCSEVDVKISRWEFKTRRAAGSIPIQAIASVASR